VLAAVPDSLRTIELLYDRGNEVREQLVTYLEEDLARIGVRLVPVALEGAEVMRRFRAGAFDAVVLGFTPAALPDPSPLFASGGAWNGMGFHDARVDSLCAALRVAPSADIDSLLAAVDARVRQTMPVTFLVHHRRIDVVSPRVLGFDGTVWLPLGSLDELRTRDE
ncbi:MAG: hypothetical protein KC729_13535, partial [Candidatus Eisenbacteria bacterium]|nr:hypothetical protein [Candidatus Eisenbacteria bacterium]